MSASAINVFGVYPRYVQQLYCLLACWLRPQSFNLASIAKPPTRTSLIATPYPTPCGESSAIYYLDGKRGRGKREGGGGRRGREGGEEGEREKKSGEGEGLLGLACTCGLLWTYRCV